MLWFSGLWVLLPRCIAYEGKTHRNRWDSWQKVWCVVFETWEAKADDFEARGRLDRLSQDRMSSCRLMRSARAKLKGHRGKPADTKLSIRFGEANEECRSYSSIWSHVMFIYVCQKGSKKSHMAATSNVVFQGESPKAWNTLSSVVGWFQRTDRPFQGSQRMRGAQRVCWLPCFGQTPRADDGAAMLIHFLEVWET